MKHLLALAAVLTFTACTNNVKEAAETSITSITTSDKILVRVDRLIDLYEKERLSNDWQRE